MKTQFDKIYVLSLISNRERQEFIKKEFDILGIDFEFIYGIDYALFDKDYQDNKIRFPVVLNDDFTEFEIARDFGCAISHYTAVDYAYNFGYNNVLIMEDDICFIKDFKLIEYYLNHIPEDADFVNFDTRFIYYDNLDNLFNEIKTTKDYFIKIDNSIHTIGGMMYGLMNRKTMEVYLENQNKKLSLSDHVSGLWDDSVIKRYISTKCICTDMFNIDYKFIIKQWTKSYTNIYQHIFNNLSPDMFFSFYKNPQLFTRCSPR